MCRFVAAFENDNRIDCFHEKISVFFVYFFLVVFRFCYCIELPHMAAWHKASLMIIDYPNNGFFGAQTSWLFPQMIHRDHILKQIKMCKSFHSET